MFIPWDGASTIKYLLGYHANRKDFYNYQLYNYSSNKPDYHNDLFTNYKPILSNKTSFEYSVDNWPFKSAGQVIISNPFLGEVLHVNKVKAIE